MAVVPISVDESALRVDARFIGRIPGIGVTLDRYAAMAALAPHQHRLLTEQGLGSYPFVTAEQIHGAEIAIVEEPSEKPIPGADGLLTMTRGITLGISVADCAPVWIIARDGTAGALLHSGKKGTESGIVHRGISELCARTGLPPSGLSVTIGPCIRRPCYEVDIATQIARQAHETGVSEVVDNGICTACHPDRYYSYRREKGLTGRMLATLTLLP